MGYRKQQNRNSHSPTSTWTSCDATMSLSPEMSEGNPANSLLPFHLYDFYHSFSVLSVCFFSLFPSSSLSLHVSLSLTHTHTHTHTHRQREKFNWRMRPSSAARQKT